MLLRRGYRVPDSHALQASQSSNIFMAVLLGSDRNLPDAIQSLIAETLPGSVIIRTNLALVRVLDELYALVAADDDAPQPWPAANGHSDRRLPPRSAAAI